MEIYGENDQYYKHVKKIKGGYLTFYSPLPSDYSPAQKTGPKITIRGIHVDEATLTSIHLLYTSGAEMSDNKIINVIPFGISRQWSSGNTLWVHKRIIFGSSRIRNETSLLTDLKILFFQKVLNDILSRLGRLRIAPTFKSGKEKKQ